MKHEKKTPLKISTNHFPRKNEISSISIFPPPNNSSKPKKKDREQVLGIPQASNIIAIMIQSFQRCQSVTRARPIPSGRRATPLVRAHWREARRRAIGQKLRAQRAPCSPPDFHTHAASSSALHIIVADAHGSHLLPPAPPPRTETRRDTRLPTFEKQR